MPNPRLIVTGNIPCVDTTQPRFDAVELLAVQLGISWDNVMHINRGDHQKLGRLQDMPSYAAAVALSDVESVLPTSTELLVFDTRPRLLRPPHTAARIANVLFAAYESGIDAHRLVRPEQFTEEYLPQRLAATHQT